MLINSESILLPAPPSAALPHDLSGMYKADVLSASTDHGTNVNLNRGGMKKHWQGPDAPKKGLSSSLKIKTFYPTDAGHKWIAWLTWRAQVVGLYKTLQR